MGNIRENPHDHEKIRTRWALPAPPSVAGADFPRLTLIRLALARLETPLGLVDHIDAALPADQAIVPVPGL